MREHFVRISVTVKPKAELSPLSFGTDCLDRERRINNNGDKGLKYIGRYIDHFKI